MTVDELKRLVGSDNFFSDDEIRKMDMDFENGSAFRMTDYTELSKQAWPLSDAEIDETIRKTYDEHVG